MSQSGRIPKTQPEQSNSRIAVDYYWPGTAAGDGRPVTGTAYYDTQTPLAAWKEHEQRLMDGKRELEPHQEIIVRAYYAKDWQDIPRLRDIIDTENLS